MAQHIPEINFTIKSSNIQTPLGIMAAVADDDYLYKLYFSDRFSIDSLSEGSNSIIKSITNELQAYFKGRLRDFTTPYKFFSGSTFQHNVWNALTTISYGHTCSYAELANTIGKPTAFRAAANANGANNLAIIIPCHRVINTNGKIGGYGGGIARKEWLLKHETKWKK